MTDDFDLSATLSDEAAALATVARLLDEAAQAGDGLYDIESAARSLLRLADEGGVPKDAPGVMWLRAAQDAISYRLSFDEDGRCAVEPYLHLGDDETVPPMVDVQPEEVVGRWRTLRETMTSPVWRGRLGYLLVASGRVHGKDKVDLAADTITDYLAVPSVHSQGLDRVDGLRVALSLARQFGLRDQRTTIIEAMLGMARTTLANESNAAGIVLGLTDALVADRHTPAEIDTVLANARTAYAGDPHRTDDVIDQQMTRAAGDASRVADLWRERVHAWLEAAEGCGDIRRAHFLQGAVEHANRSGDKALRQEATARLQELTLTDLGLQGIKYGMVLRGEDIARAVRDVTDAPTWTDALHAFATLGPPTGDVDANRTTVEEHAKEFVLSKLFPITQFGSDGLPRWHATTDEERREYDLTQQEVFHLEFQRRIVAEALLRFPAHHPLPTEQELTSYFARRPHVPPTLAAALARSFLRWWAGDYEGAGFTVAPRIEALARNLLLSVNTPLYRLQREKAPGQYPGLGFLLEQLRQYGFPEGWYRYLFTFLANGAGLNVRNELSHGFMDYCDLGTSALLLQCAAVLALLQTGPSAAPADDNQQAPPPVGSGDVAAESTPAPDVSPPEVTAEEGSQELP